MNVLELFAGIGGLSLGLERAGFHVVGQVEIHPFSRSILEKHWPVDRLKALGNAVVPQVAEFVGRLLQSGAWLDDAPVR